MKKTIFLLTTAALICSGCNSAPADTAKARTTAAAITAEQTTTTAQTAASERTTTAAQTTTVLQTADNFGEGKTDIRYTILSGNTCVEMGFYEEDSLSGDDSFYRFDYAYVCPAQGFYDDSIMHPDVFDADDYKYSGTEKYVIPQDCMRVTAGDEAGGVKIKSAETYIARDGFNTLMSMSADCEGEYVMTGILRYFSGDDYNISAGDILFYPDSSIAGFPLPAAMREPRPVIADISVCCELQNGIRLGNVINKNSGRHTAQLPDTLSDDVLNDITGIIGTGTRDVMTKVKVSLSDILLEWSDQFGMSRCCAILNAIKPLPEG